MESVSRQWFLPDYAWYEKFLVSFDLGSCALTPEHLVGVPYQSFQVALFHVSFITVVLMWKVSLDHRLPLTLCETVLIVLLLNLR